MAEEAQKAIEITEFVPASKVDPVYFDGAYYLGPDKGGEKAYKLINEAMKQTGRAALAKWAARGKQYLVLIRPVDNGLVMQQLLYKDEVRTIAEVPIEDGGAQGLGAEARGAAHRADRERRVPARELRGRGPQALPRGDPAQGRRPGGHRPSAEAPKSAQIIDLMEALKASLAAKNAAAADAKAGAKAGRLRREEDRHRRLRSRAHARLPASRHPRRRRLRALPAAAALVPRGGAREGEALPRPGVLGPPRARLRRPAGAPAGGGPRPRRPRRQSHRARLHRRPLRRFPVRRPPPRGLREPGRSRRDAATACVLRDCYIAPVARCAPPANKPTPVEIGRCREYLAREWALLTRVRAVLVLGRIAMDGFLAMVRESGRTLPRRPEFAHGAVHDLGGDVRLFCSYHVSQQNTFTRPPDAAQLRRRARGREASPGARRRRDVTASVQRASWVDSISGEVPGGRQDWSLPTCCQ